MNLTFDCVLDVDRDSNVKFNPLGSICARQGDVAFHRGTRSPVLIEFELCECSYFCKLIYLREPGLNCWG